MKECKISNLAINEQLKIIMKGVESIVGKEELKEKLQRAQKENQPLNIKLGLDPSAPDIHLGHAVVLRKIKQFQDLGHHAVIIIGDFTGRIGDPTGKSKGRTALSEEEVKANALTYQKQIFKILDPSKTTIRFNSEWLRMLNFEEIIALSSVTTVARMLERDDFQRRYKNNVPIGLHEFFYPLMQAYDSLAVSADIELGGSDQTFNILMGRTLQKSKHITPQAAIFMPLLEGLDGQEKMSKSLGNYIGITESSEVMFKKVMELPDSLILKYYNLATDVHPDSVKEIAEELTSGKNPRDVKLELAKTITSLYHTTDEVKKAELFYMQAFTKKIIPDNIPELSLPDTITTMQELIPFLVSNGILHTNSEFRRLLSQGGIQKNGKKTTNLSDSISSKDVLKIGKKNFIRFI